MTQAIQELSIKPNQTAQNKPQPRAYKSSFQSVNYVFKDGTKAAFMGGKYVTSNAREIAELDAEIENGHPTFTKASLAEAEELTKSPMEALRAKFFKEFQASQAAAVDKNNDAGFSEQVKLNPTSSSQVAEAAAGSTGVDQAPVGGVSGLKISLGSK